MAAGSTEKYSDEDRNALGNQGCWLRYLDRQGEMKGRSSSIISGRPQPAAMRLHNGTADGQPHPAALRFGGEKRRKDLVNTLGRQSRPHVTDRELELTVLQLRFNRKL